MKFNLSSVLLAACCLWALSWPACALRPFRSANRPADPPSKPAAPPAPVQIAADQPISVPQTQVTLPTPQPIQTEALAINKPESPLPTPPAQVAKPQRTAQPKPQPPQQTNATTPAGPQPPPAAPPASRRRIRPVESAAERQRMLNDISSRQRQAQDILAKARTRQLSESEKNTADRIQAFLDQTDAALKDQDLQQAAALSNRALILCQELNEK